MSKKTTSTELSCPVESTLLDYLENLCEVMNLKKESCLDAALENYLFVEGLSMMESMVAAIEAKNPTARQRRLLKRMPQHKALFDENARRAREYVAGYMAE